MSTPLPAPVRITVDREACMGSGTCLAIAPALFGIADDGAARPKRSAIESDTQLGEAISRCPTGAIVVLAATAPDHSE